MKQDMKEARKKVTNDITAIFKSMSNTDDPTAKRNGVMRLMMYAHQLKQGKGGE